VEASEGSFIVRDVNGFAVTYVYWKLQLALNDRYMTTAEAGTVAEARLLLATLTP
jgi:hypothetical protein